MSDEIKNLIWELAEPQLEIYDRMNLSVEHKLLENKVLDIFQEIEEAEVIVALNAYHDGNVEAQNTIEELQNQIQRVIEHLRDTAFTLEREYGR